MQLSSILKRVIKPGLYLLFIIFILIFLLFIIRFLSARQIDDVSPGIPCDQDLLQKADVLFVIPKFQNKPISDNPEWCNQILNLDKDLEIHGVLHTYEEFGKDLPRDYFDEGVKIFSKCFNKTPNQFKPPQLSITNNNKKFISREMKVDTIWNNDIFHKVYHCSDTGKFSNKFNDWF